MAASLYLARRYLLSHRPGAWGWMIGWLATGSVALGVAALIVTLAVMTGFREDIREKILGVQPHVIVTTFDGVLNVGKGNIRQTLDKDSDVRLWSPYVSGQVLMGRGSQSSGSMVKGIDPDKEPEVANLKGRLLVGNWDDLRKPAESPERPKPRIILGQELARNLGARVGDTIWLITPGALNIGALSVPKANLFVVSGIVQSGLYDYDASLAYVNLPEAQALFGLGTNVSGIGVRVKDPEQADDVARRLQLQFDGAYWVRSWLSLNRNLFSALKLEKVVMFTILTMVTVVASVMIVSNLLLSISQKTREIGILRAMGATGNAIRAVFLYQGVLMGALGTVIGTGLGIAVALVLGKTNIIRLPADVYYIDHLPIRIEPLDIALVVTAATIIVLIATLYPAHRATEVDPLDAIRYG